MTRRAEAQAETRQRIVDAVVALHEEVGPKETTISAIAEKAGVQRLTVYRHFPDEKALLKACTSQWADANPWPGIALWNDIEGFEARTKAALEALYGYYGGTHRMWRKSYRDAEDVPALDGPMKGFEAYLKEVRESLLEAAKDRPQTLTQTLDHVLAFPTWESLDHLCGKQAECISLALSWVMAQTAG